MKMNELNKRIFVILASILLTATIIVFAIYYYLGIGFGNAVVNTAKGIRDAKEKWSQEGVNPMDTIKEQIREMTLDSSESKED